MRRLALLAALVVAVLAPSGAGAAWTETATYDVPGGGIADCLRAAGTDRLALLGSLGRISTPTDLLALQGDRLAPLATSTLGWLDDCPEIATADGAPALAAGTVLRPRGRGSFGTALRVATLGEAPQTLRPAGGTPSVATAPGGAAIVAWIKRRPTLNGTARVMAAIRPSASAPFRTPAAVDDGPADQREVVAGIDAAGRAIVAWRTESPRNSLQEVIHVATADASGHFGLPRTLARTRGLDFALAVAPDGRALLVADSLDDLHAFERLPDQAGFTRIPLPSVPYVEELAVALNPEGGAVIAYRTDPWSTAALVRSAGGAFREGGDIAVRRLGNFRPLESAYASPLVSSLGTHAEPPEDMAAQDLAVALTPSGQMLMTWVQDEEGERAASAYVARGTLTDGFGAPSRVGGACRSATAARPLRFDDDLLGVTWADDARIDTRQGGLRRLGGGRAHVARDLAPGVPLASAPAAPRMSARLVAPPALRASDPLRVRVRCEHACDVRAVAVARTLPQPWWSVYGRRGGARQVLDASDALPAGGRTTLRLDPENGSNAAGARGLPRTPIVVLACTPGNAVAERIELPAPRAVPPGRIPSITGLAARRRGDLVRATWRTTAPARRTRFTAYLLLTGGVQKPILAHVAGHGRTHFAATLHVPHGRRATRVGLVMRSADLREPDQTLVRVRRTRFRTSAPRALQRATGSEEVPCAKGAAHLESSPQMAPVAPPDLARQFRRYLAALELVSHGTTTRLFEDAMRHRRQGSRILILDAEPYPHERLQMLWDKATSLDAWEEVLAETRETLHNLRKSPPAPKAYRERGTIAWKRMIANDRQTPVAELARQHGVSRKTVYDYRRTFGQPP